MVFLRELGLRESGEINSDGKVKEGNGKAKEGKGKV